MRPLIPGRDIMAEETVSRDSPGDPGTKSRRPRPLIHAEDRNRMNMEKKYRNPLVTVDIIIEAGNGIILIERLNPPYGWALPGGFVDYGESLEASAVREAREETSLDVKLVEQFHSYSDPGRDPRHHSVTTVFIATSTGVPMARDDAKDLGIFTENAPPSLIVFDHEIIIRDYFSYRKGNKKKEIFFH